MMGEMDDIGHLIEKLFESMQDLNKEMDDLDERREEELKKEVKGREAEKIDFILRQYALANQRIALNKYTEKSGLASGAMISLAEQFEADTDIIRIRLLEIYQLNKKEIRKLNEKMAELYKNSKSGPNNLSKSG